jgi:plasmid stabilization system protein ParE
MTHGFEEEALQEYLEAAQYYAERRGGLGEVFVREVRSLLDLIARGQERFQLVDQGVRVGRLKRFPYRIYFRYDPESDHATIFAVMHERRRPDYWQGRLSGG